VILRIELPGELEATHTNPAEALDIEPIVYRADGKPICAYLSVYTNSGRKVSQCALAVSAATGAICLIRRKPTTALIDQNDATPITDDQDEETEEELEDDDVTNAADSAS